MTGAQIPRYCIEPERLSTDGADAAALMAAYGNALDEWQRLVLDCWLGRDTSGRYTVTSAGLGAVIPPSVFMIIFGASNRISIADLFAAGVGPGLLAAALRRTLPWYARWRQAPPQDAAGPEGREEIRRFFHSVTTVIQALPWEKELAPKSGLT